jgi:hypothetical protein
VFVDSFFGARLLGDEGVIVFDDSGDLHVRKVLNFVRTISTRASKKWIFRRGVATVDTLVWLSYRPPIRKSPVDGLSSNRCSRAKVERSHSTPSRPGQSPAVKCRSSILGPLNESPALALREW